MMSSNTYTLDDYQKYSAPQARADAIFQGLNGRAAAPRVLEGEGVTQYRKRLAAELKQHSPTWKNVDVAGLYGAAFDVAETQIFADAEREARHPTNIPKGEIVTRVTNDATGRPITRFFASHPGAVWDKFKPPFRYVKRWGDEKTGVPVF